MSSGKGKTYALLPHEFPCVMIDKVYDVEIGKRGRGIKLIPGDDVLGRGKVFPSVFLIETAAQLSGIISGREKGGVIAGLRNMSFGQEVYAGDAVQVSSAMNGAFGGVYSFSVMAVCRNETVMEGEIFLALA